ncbi:hypothetical protein B0H21DRAFT_756285 [Amylocystis lapponica]|nr:hypothetical protein B0H21DRAFT_756285 [Amylocystis lapponica]
MNPPTTPRKNPPTTPRKKRSAQDALFIPAHIGSPIKKPRPSVNRAGKIVEQPEPISDADAEKRNELLKQLPVLPTHRCTLLQCTRPAVDLFHSEDNYIKEGAAGPHDISIRSKGTTGLVVLSAVNTLGSWSLEPGRHGYIYTPSAKRARLAEFREVHLIKRYNSNEDIHENLQYLGVYKFHNPNVNLSSEGYGRLEKSVRESLVDYHCLIYRAKHKDSPEELAAMPDFDAQYRSGSLPIGLLTVEWLREDPDFKKTLNDKQNRTPMAGPYKVKRNIQAAVEKLRAECAARGETAPVRKMSITPDTPRVRRVLDFGPPKERLGRR